MNEKEDPEHVTLTRLLGEVKPLVEPLFPDQKKNWVAESELAQDIIAILAHHPEYYDEVRARLGDIFPRPKAKGTGA